MAEEVQQYRNGAWRTVRLGQVPVKDRRRIDTDYLAERDPADPFGLTHAQRIRSDFDPDWAALAVKRFDA